MKFDISDGKFCSFIDFDSGDYEKSQLKGEACDNDIRLICEVDCTTTTAATATTTTPDPTVCPGFPAAVKSGSVGFIAVDSFMEQPDAKSYCTTNYGSSSRLASVTDKSLLEPMADAAIGAFGV